VAGVAGVLVVPLALALGLPRTGRLTRVAVVVAAGGAALVAGGVAHVLDLVTTGPRWEGATGVGFAAGGALLLGAAAAAAAGAGRPPRASRPRRAAQAAIWLAGASLVGQFGVVPYLNAVVVTHAVRLPVDDSALGVAHERVQLRTAGRASSASPTPSAARSSRGVSGTRTAPALVDIVGLIAPRPVLLIAAGGRPDELPVNRRPPAGRGPGGAAVGAPRGRAHRRASPGSWPAP